MHRRREFKYLVPKDRLNEFRSVIAPYVEKDQNLDLNNLLDYKVNSIYFDTGHLSFYKEKLAGLKLRKKFRIRSYNKQTEDSIVFVEIKQKEENIISKNRAPVYYRDIKQFLIWGNIDQHVLSDGKFPNAHSDARKFLYYYFGKNLVPVVLIVYDREAYHSKFNPDLRITFDKNIRSKVCTSTDELFTKYKTEYILRDYFVLEIKFYSGYPLWLRKIVRKFSLQQRSVSKYSHCVDRHIDELDMHFKRSSYEWAKEYYLKNDFINEEVV